MGAAGIAAYASLAGSVVLGLLAWSSNRSTSKAEADNDHEGNLMGGFNNLAIQYAAANAALGEQVTKLRAEVEATSAVLAEVRRHASQCDDNLDTERRHRQRLEAEVADLRRRVERSEP